MCKHLHKDVRIESTPYNIITVIYCLDCGEILKTETEKREE